MNGDGRMDVLETNGWREQLAEPGAFRLHEVKFAEAGGAQMFAEDLDGAFGEEGERCEVEA